MRKKTLLVLFIVGWFASSIIFTNKASATSNATVYINPPNIFDPTLAPGTLFTIDILVENVENLRGYQFEMSFNPNILQGASVAVGSFLGSAGGTVLELDGSGFNNEAGKLGLTGAMLWEKDPTYCPDGSGVLATVTFEVVGYGGSILRLGPDTGLTGSDGNWIIHGLDNVRHGYFANQETHDVVISSIRCLETGVYQGQPIHIEVIVDNEGTFAETFNVTVFAVRWGGGEEAFIGRQTAQELPSGASLTLLFVWDTTSALYGTYEIYAEASALPGESAKTNNDILHMTFGGIGAPPHQWTLMEMFISWAMLAVKMLPVAAAVMLAIVIFKSLMSLKVRRSIRWIHK